MLCEKPLALTIRAANVIADAATRANRIVSVAENHRRDPINRLAQSLICDGAIGEPRLMVETHVGGRDRIAITPWRHMKHTGTIALDAGVHYADILRSFLGEVRTVLEKPDCTSGCATSGATGHWIDDNAGHGKPIRSRQVFGSRGSLESPGDRNGRPNLVYLDDGTVIGDAHVLDLAPSYRLDALAAELFGGERIWTYDLEFNGTDKSVVGPGVPRARQVRLIRS